jgi:hypothetical protein
VAKILQLLPSGGIMRSLFVFFGVVIAFCCGAASAESGHAEDQFRPIQKKIRPEDSRRRVVGNGRLAWKTLDGTEELVLESELSPKGFRARAGDSLAKKITEGGLVEKPVAYMGYIDPKTGSVDLMAVGTPFYRARYATRKEIEAYDEEIKKNPPTVLPTFRMPEDGMPYLINEKTGKVFRPVLQHEMAMAYVKVGDKEIAVGGRWRIDPPTSFGAGAAGVVELPAQISLDKNPKFVQVLREHGVDVSDNLKSFSVVAVGIHEQ